MSSIRFTSWRSYGTLAISTRLFTSFLALLGNSFKSLQRTRSYRMIIIRLALEKTMYSAVVLDEKSQLKLQSWAEKNIKVNHIRLPILVRDNGWKMICHHMTVKFPGTPEYLKRYLNTNQSLDVTHVGVSDKVVAVRVVGFPSDNKIPHITVAVNVREGGKPVMSNQITDWTPVSDKLTLKGTFEELQ